MELYERILTKEEINNRFIRATDAILMNKLISSKVGLAESLHVKPAKFSEILNRRMKAGVDMIAIMCDFYKVSPDWLLMGRGNNVFRNCDMPKYWIDDEDLNINYPGDSMGSNVSDKSIAQTENNPLMPVIKEQANTIKEQAEEIGKLKEQIRQLTIEKAKHVSDAATSNIANVG